MKVLVVYKGLAERIKQRIPADIEVIYPETGTDEELVRLAKDVEVTPPSSNYSRRQGQA